MTAPKQPVRCGCWTDVGNTLPDSDDCMFGEVVEALEDVHLAIKDSIFTGLSMNNHKYDAIGQRVFNLLTRIRSERE